MNGGRESRRLRPALGCNVIDDDDKKNKNRSTNRVTCQVISGFRARSGPFKQNLFKHKGLTYFYHKDERALPGNAQNQ
jgi:hypothetical protein